MSIGENYTRNTVDNFSAEVSALLNRDPFPISDIDIVKDEEYHISEKI